MRRFVLTRAAERDLDQIKNYLVEKAGPTITRRVLRDVRAVMELLGNEPGAGHVRPDLTSLPVKFWTVYDYLVVYDPASKPIQIIRVIHARRNVAELLT